MYVGFIVIGVIVFVGAAILINIFKNPKWIENQEEKKDNNKV